MPRKHPVITMIGGAILAAWIPFWRFLSVLSTIDFMRTSTGRPSLGTFFLPHGVADGITVLGLGVMVYAFMVQARRSLPERTSVESVPVITVAPKPPPIPPQEWQKEETSVSSTAQLLRLDQRTIVIPIGGRNEVRILARYNESLTIELKDIPTQSRKDSSTLEPCAHVYLNIGGALIHGGEEAIKISTNEYILFRPTLVEPDAAMAYATFFGNQYFRFLAVYVEYINTHERTVEFAVVSVG
jgi:hypothetical protein